MSYSDLVSLHLDFNSTEADEAPCIRRLIFNNSVFLFSRKYSKKISIQTPSAIHLLYRLTNGSKVQFSVRLSDFKTDSPLNVRPALGEGATEFPVSPPTTNSLPPAEKCGETPPQCTKFHPPKRPCAPLVMTTCSCNQIIFRPFREKRGSNDYFDARIPPGFFGTENPSRRPQA